MRRAFIFAALTLGCVSPPALAQNDPWIEVENDLSAIAIHAIMLPPVEVGEVFYASGLVLYYQRTNHNNDPVLQVAHLWDPESYDTVGTTPNPGVNLFCASHAIDYAGRVIFAGGTAGPGCGVDQVTVYDHYTNWMTDAGDMDDGRWYPTVMMDAMGEAYFFAGDRAYPNCTRNLSIEEFDPYTTGDPAVVVQELEEAPPNYPRGHLLSDGRMAMVGPPADTKFFDTLQYGVNPGPTTEIGSTREGSTSVMLPVDLRDETPDERVLLISGYVNGAPNNTSEVLFLNQQQQWEWDYTADNLTYGRGHANAVLLANGQVFLIGGGREDLQDCPIFVPEVYDPATENWTALTSAMHTHPRMYHSVALLLMDGSVWTAGQNEDSFCTEPPPCPTCDPEEEYWPQAGNKAEIYRPPYFFDASRPEITDVQASVEPEEVFDVAYTVGNGRSMDNEDGARVALISLSAVTHSVNMTQRYLILPHVLDDIDPEEVINVTAPPAEYAPPGPYMLVLIDDTGIPSVAKAVFLD